MTWLVVLALGVTVELPNGDRIEAMRVTYDLGTQTVFIVEAPLFKDGFE